MSNRTITTSSNAPTDQNAALCIFRMVLKRRQVLLATTKVELKKKYSGSVLGPLWIVLFPTLLLSVYLFIYLVVFPVRMPEFSSIAFVLFVFCGLVPYLGLLEVVGAGTLAVKQNIHLVKNIMMPIELIPIRAVMIGMVGELVSLAVLLVLLAVTGSLTWHVLWLPLAIALQFCFFLGIVYVLSAIAVSLPDISYFVGLILILLMFVSPIGFQPEKLGGHLLLPLVYLNPISYMIEVFRDSLLYGRFPTLWTAGVYTALCVGCLMGGAAFFSRFKNVLIDYE